MTRNLILLLLLAITTSCSEGKQEDKKTVSDKVVKHFPQWNTDDYKKPNVAVTQQVENLVQLLEQDTIVPSHRYAEAYTQLKATATDDELVLLTGHNNPVIRCHAYNALVKREYKAIHRICFAHFNDTIQKVHCRVTDKVIPLSVRTWMIWKLRPESGAKYKFESKVYGRYILDYNDLKKELKKAKIRELRLSKSDSPR